MNRHEPAHVTAGYAAPGRGWTCRAYREGRAYDGRGSTQEEAEAACDEALAVDGWPRGPGPRWGAEPRPRSQGEQLEPLELLAQVAR